MWILWIIKDTFIWNLTTQHPTRMPKINLVIIQPIARMASLFIETFIQTLN